MGKVKYFLLVDPIETFEKGSHNSDVNWFVKNLLDEDSIDFEIGFTIKECKSKYESLNKVGTLFKLTLAAFINAVKAIKLARHYDLTVFNPNDDPISLFVLQRIRNIARSNFTIKSRFICTRDRMLLKKNSFLINRLKKNISISIRLGDKISAETQSYSEFLSREFEIRVEFVPYPPIDIRFYNVKISKQNNLFVALGASRKDKGFETLPIWINQISRKNPLAHFVIQSASKEWKGYRKALEVISKLENVKIIPSYIDERSQYEILASAYAILAPYDEVTYQFRGSAFTRRAMYLGKVIYVSSNTSMSKDAEIHDLLTFPESIVGNLNTAQAHRDRQALGTNLQKESIRFWRRFLL